MGTFDAVKKEWKLEGQKGTIKATVRKLAQYFDVTLEATEDAIEALPSPLKARRGERE
jgi:hypothetical protein